MNPLKIKNLHPALILKTTTGIPSYIDRDRVLSMIQEIKKTVRGKCPNIYLLHGGIYR